MKAAHQRWEVRNLSAAAPRERMRALCFWTRPAHEASRIPWHGMLLINLSAIGTSPPSACQRNNTATHFAFAGPNAHGRAQRVTLARERQRHETRSFYL